MPLSVYELVSESLSADDGDDEDISQPPVKAKRQSKPSGKQVELGETPTIFDDIFPPLIETVQMRTKSSARERDWRKTKKRMRR